MKWMIRTIPTFVLFSIGVMAFVGDIQATPSQSDITVVGLAQSQGGIPHCSLLDGAVKVTNSSSTYEYKVHVDAWTGNDAYGNGRCGLGAGCEDNQDPCTCDFEIVMEISTNDSRVGTTGCVFPICESCTLNCDNSTCDPDGDYDHCTCTYGVYGATHYREPPETLWTEMAPSFGTAITERDSHPDCPDSPTEPCDY